MRRFILFFSLALLPLFAEPRLHVVTVANKSNQNLDSLVKSANHFGMEVEVAGKKQLYLNDLYKLYRMKEHLESLSDDDIVLFVDPSNTIILGSEEEIVKEFIERNIPCIFAAERKLHPKKLLSQLNIDYPESSSSFRYLHSGCFIGYASFLQMMINEIILERYSIPLKCYSQVLNPQFHFQKYFGKNQRFFQLDSNNDLFLVLSDMSRNEIVLSKGDKSVFVKETKGQPLVIYGDSKESSLYMDIASMFNR